MLQQLLVPDVAYLIIGGPKIPANGGTPQKEDFIPWGTFRLRDPVKGHEIDVNGKAIGFSPPEENGGTMRDVTGLTEDGKKFRARYNPRVQKGLKFQLTG